jgi:site-specific recombinase XerD
MSQPFEPANKGRTYPAEILTPEEVGMLFRACSSRAPTGIRNRALLTILYRSGLRVSEALDLSLKDIDRQACTVRVLHGKGNRARALTRTPSLQSIAGSTNARNSALEGGLASSARLAESRSTQAMCDT